MVRDTEFTQMFENPSSSIVYQLDRNRIEVIEKKEIYTSLNYQGGDHMCTTKHTSSWSSK